MWDARVAFLILSGKPSDFSSMKLQLHLYTYNGCMQGLILGVHLDLQQIFVCMHLPHSTDWPYIIFPLSSLLMLIVNKMNTTKDT